MVSKEIRIPITEYSSVSETGPSITPLIDLALAAAKDAYAPYSGYHVGASIELADGQIFRSSNQENKAYPSGLCAERTAIFYVQANHPATPIARLVVLAMEDGELTDEPAYPCGGCRQVMVEAEERHNTPMEVWMVGKNRIVKVESAASLLPLKFDF
jgi:cytidine deaminase